MTQSSWSIDSTKKSFDVESVKLQAASGDVALLVVEEQGVLGLEHGGLDAVLKHVGIPQPGEAVRGVTAFGGVVEQHRRRRAW